MSQNILEYKIISLGDSGVGKTSIFKRYAFGQFDEDTMTTIGLTFADKNYILQNREKVNLKLVDTGGQEKFRSLAKNYYKNADGVLFVFDHNNKETFEHIKEWIKLFEENTTDKEIPKFLIGNKNDLENFGNQELFENFIKEHNILRYISTSAKDNININKTFKEMAEIIDSNYNKSGSQHTKKVYLSKRVQLEKEKKRKKKEGCKFCSGDLYYK